MSGIGAYSSRAVCLILEIKGILYWAGVPQPNETYFFVAFGRIVEKDDYLIAGLQPSQPVIEAALIKRYWCSTFLSSKTQVLTS